MVKCLNLYSQDLFPLWTLRSIKNHTHIIVLLQSVWHVWRTRHYHSCQVYWSGKSCTYCTENTKQFSIFFFISRDSELELLLLDESSSPFRDLSSLTVTLLLLHLVQMFSLFWDINQTWTSYVTHAPTLVLLQTKHLIHFNHFIGIKWFSTVTGVFVLCRYMFLSFQCEVHRAFLPKSTGLWRFKWAVWESAYLRTVRILWQLHDGCFSPQPDVWTHWWNTDKPHVGVSVNTVDFPKNHTQTAVCKIIKRNHQ